MNPRQSNYPRLSYKLGTAALPLCREGPTLGIRGKYLSLSTSRAGCGCSREKAATCTTSVHPALGQWHRGALGTLRRQVQSPGLGLSPGAQDRHLRCLPDGVPLHTCDHTRVEVAGVLARYLAPWSQTRPPAGFLCFFYRHSPTATSLHATETTGLLAFILSAQSDLSGPSRALPDPLTAPRAAAQARSRPIP